MILPVNCRQTPQCGRAAGGHPVEVLALVAAQGDGHIVLVAARLASQGVVVPKWSSHLEGVWIIARGPGYPAVSLLPPHADLVALGLQVVVGVGC